MAEKETIILDFQVDQGSAIQELEKTKKSIIQLKEEQAELNKAYKAGNVTLEEYVSETVRLEGILKKQQATYTNTQKSVTGVKTKMDDLIASNNKLAKSVEESTQNITVAGVSVGDLTAKIASFANPATAAVGIVTALGAAYSRSSIGAKDLEFAQNQLNFVIDTATDKFASLFSSVEDGQGILTKYLNAYLQVGYYTPIGQALRLFGVDLQDIAKESKEAAQAVADLNNVRDEFTLHQSTINERLAQNADLMADLSNTELKANDRLKKAQEIRENINKNTRELLVFKGAEIEAENKLLKIRKEAGGDTGAIQLRISKLIQDMTAIDVNESRQLANINKQINAINKQEQARLNTQQKQNDALAFQTSELERQARIAKLDRESEKQKDISGIEDPFGTEGLKDQEIKLDTERVERFKSIEKTKREQYKKTFRTKKELQMADLAFTESMLDQAAELFGEQTAAGKVLAAATATINTYRGATLALAELPPPFSYIQAALTIATGLASVAKIQGVAAAGGADFVTSKPTMLLVGDNPGGRERVTVEPLSGRGKTRTFGGGAGIAMAGGGSVTFDGAKELAVQTVQQNLQLRNAIKNQPAPVVSWREGQIIGKRVTFKENLSKR